MKCNIQNPTVSSHEIRCLPALALKPHVLKLPTVEVGSVPLLAPVILSARPHRGFEVAVGFEVRGWINHPPCMIPADRAETIPLVLDQIEASIRREL